MKHKVLIIMLVALFCLQAVAVQATDFDKCIAELQSKAKQQGFSAQIVNDVLANLQLQPRVIELDRSQPEFTQTFANYYYRRVTPERIKRGQDLLKKHEPYLAGLTKKYGVPGRYLVAFWGLETNFGSYLGTMPILDSLATLACDQRRSEFFTVELMQALTLLQRESLTPDTLRGSWAGAMGHTQFMPSAYNRYAIDGDGDDRINLWQSELDALASGANYLAHLGWQKGERWGREILLPADFAYSRTSLSNRLALNEWKMLGVKFANGATIPEIDMEASVLLPAGHKGPAFLVYANFNVMMRWNRSEYYALAVGLLADQLIGAGQLTQPPSTEEVALSRITVEKMQQQLNSLGFDAGEIDGIMGSSTRSALRSYQASNGLVADGYPDTTTLCALKVLAGHTSCL